MSERPAPAVEPIDSLIFAEKYVGLVAYGDHNSTYKVATAIAILQAAIEVSGDAISSARIAELVIELYWRQGATVEGAALRQMNRPDQTSAIDAALESLRKGVGGSRGFPPVGTREYAGAVRKVERTLLAWPLRLLQPANDQFIFHVPDPSRRSPAAFGPMFDSQIHLRPGVGSALRRIAPIARRLLEIEWIERVARYNGLDLDERRLRNQLFGYTRQSWPSWLRPALEELQNGCFYCGGALPRRTASDGSASTRATHVDHFIPWVASMNDAIENLVLADDRCNLLKSDRPPTPSLVDAWLDRLSSVGDRLTGLATQHGWPSNVNRTLSIAESYYGRYTNAPAVLGWNGQGLVAMSMDAAIDSLRGSPLRQSARTSR